MIDSIALKTTIIDSAVTGQISSDFRPNDSVKDIISALPVLSNKRKKLLGQSFEYGKQARLPAHWKWICLGEITSYGDTPQKAYYDNVGSDKWVLDLEDIKSGGQLINKTRVCDKKFAGEKTVFNKGQVLYSKLRPYLKKVLVADEDGISTPELISFDAFGGMIPQYIVYCLLSSFTDRAIEKRSYGVKMPRIDAAFMVNLPIPVPPVSEQQFIVDRVQAALSQIDIIDGLQKKYADNLSALKSKVIDLAIRGKLTEQLPEDGTAEELYQQIQEEKQALIKEGKIKKERPLPDISDTEIPFDIPDNWKWCRLGSVSEIAGGTTPKANETSETGDIPYFKVSDMNVLGNETHMIHASCFISESYSGKIFPKGTIIYPKNGGAALTNKRRMLIKNSAIDLNTGGCTPLLESTTKWVRFLFETIDFNDMNTGSNIPTVNATALKRRLVPIPPLSEQKRIVKKLDEVLEIVNI